MVTFGSCSEERFTSEYHKVLYRDGSVFERRGKPWLGDLSQVVSEASGRARFIIKT